ncbi:RNA polymerase sigma-70 factor [Nocardioides caldifontis]|uniref:RNA polymerase sigma-70 factor n=1 Tax=Nocardioides caldifontis TaxID=2588938 RepID=UPI001EF000EA|nr:RNA polymerase sigma-70 factor [Nocardioides caldifontis]
MTGDHVEQGTDAFAEHRSLLFTVAYEMLGSAADAEDVVQESWVRWSEVDKARVRDPRAYLVRIVTRQALNHLRTLERRRERYVGPWLPEPLLTAPDVADDVELADSVSLAMLVVLDTLSPLERAVFLLREVFGFGYDEVAEATGRSTAAVRQLAHRAREHVQARRPGTIPAGELEKVTTSFFAAAATGDLQQLMDLLAPDVVLLSDGGGKVKAALNPIRGAEKVARFLLAVTPTGAQAEVDVLAVNGAPALVVRIDGRIDTVATGVMADGRIAELLVVRNPDKLRRLEEEHHLSRR